MSKDNLDKAKLTLAKTISNLESEYKDAKNSDNFDEL